jgi:hypothetical protein
VVSLSAWYEVQWHTRVSTWVLFEEGGPICKARNLLVCLLSITVTKYLRNSAYEKERFILAQFQRFRSDRDQLALSLWFLQ